MARKSRMTVPIEVLERVKATGVSVRAQKPAVPPVPKGRALLPREKVVAALKKLHPMD